MKSGEYFIDQMEKGLIECKFLVLMVTKNSINSNAVSAEWKNKYLKKFGNSDERIFPFIVDDTEFSEMPDFLSMIHSYKYDDESKINQLVDDIQFWNAESKE